MKLKTALLSCLSLIFCFDGYSQGLDDIFDDGQRTAMLAVGTSVSWWFCGAANIETDLRLFDNRVTARAGFAALPFNTYKNTALVTDEASTMLKTGNAFNAGLNFRLSRGGFDGYVEIYAGPRIEVVNLLGYNIPESSNLVGMGYYEKTSNAYRAAFNRKMINYGLSINGLYTINTRFSILLGISGGIGQVNMKYDPSNSYNVDWKTGSPQGWFTYKWLTGYGRLNFSLYYHLNFRS